MDFWSKGLGKRTVRLYLRDGKVAKSGDKLYVSGRMAEPMSWDYIMPLEGDDFAEFMQLLREPEVASFLYNSPKRGTIYRKMVVDGLRLVALLVVALVRNLMGRGEEIEEPTIQVPPPRERKPRKAGDRTRLGTRRRLNRPRTTPTDGAAGSPPPGTPTTPSPGGIGDGGQSSPPSSTRAVG